MDTALLKTGWNCKCPKCNEGDLYKSTFDLALKDKCNICGLDFTKNDSADGPAVLLIFILGFLIVPIALLADHLLTWPLWLHGLVWGVLTLILIVASLRPIKAYIIAIQYKHRPRDWE